MCHGMIDPCLSGFPLTACLALSPDPGSLALSLPFLLTYFFFFGTYVDFFVENPGNEEKGVT